MAGPSCEIIKFTAMGSPCAIHCEAEPELARSVAAAVIAEVHRIEAKYSRYLPSSLLSRINRVAAEGGEIELDDETSALIDYARSCHVISGGAFDVTSGVLRKAWDFTLLTPPDPGKLERLLTLIGFDRLGWSAPVLRFPIAGMEIDFGGIAKEYAVDRAVDICRALGAGSVLIDLGGDLAVSGPRLDGAGWSVVIRGANQTRRAFASIELRNGAVASSGDYARYVEIDGRRYGHLLDPRTGWPVSGLRAVSVHADRALAAGSCSTIGMLKGADGARWLTENRLAHAGMAADGRCFATPPLRLEPDGVRP